MKTTTEVDPLVTCSRSIHVGIADEDVAPVRHRRVTGRFGVMSAMCCAVRRVVRRFRPGLALTGLLAGGMAITAASCKKPEQVAAPPPSVQVMEVKPSKVPLSAEFIGQLDSPQNVEVRARVEAFVDKVLFTEGTEVKEGDPLFLLDKKPFLERLATAEGLLAEARAALNKFDKDVARLKPLAEKRAIPQQDLDNALASVDVGKANVQSMESRVASAKIDLSYCDVNAPVSGLIGAKQVSPGSLVGKGEPTLLATISPLDPIWFYCNLGEVEYLKADAEVRRTGRKLTELKVTLVLADGSVHPGAGKIVFVDRAVDSKTGTLRIRAEFPNPQKSLRPGMFARVKVDVGTLPEGILVPERAVVELQGRNFVWVVDQENKATQCPVKVGARIGSEWLVEDGLKPGGRVIVEGVQKVREGAVVKPMTAAEMAPTLAAASVEASPSSPKREKE